MQNRDSGLIETSTRRQIVWGFRVLGRGLAYYIQYCPEMPDPLFVSKLKRLDFAAEIADLDYKADEFIKEMLLTADRFKGE